MNKKINTSKSNIFENACIFDTIILHYEMYMNFIQGRKRN